HPHVEQHRVRAGLADERKHLFARVGLADDLDVLVARQRGPNRLQHQAVVVHDENLESPHGPNSPYCPLRLDASPPATVGRRPCIYKESALELDLSVALADEGPTAVVRSVPMRR